MRSMTGFGTARTSNETRTFAVEIRAVNHRYCEVRVRVPHELSGIEPRLEARVRRRVERGRVDVTVEAEYSTEIGAMPEVDLARARAYRDAYVAIARALGMVERVSLEAIAAAPGVLRIAERPTDLEDVAKALEPAIDAGLGDLLAMRKREGDALRQDLERRLGNVTAFVEGIQMETPRANADRKVRLEARLSELLGDRGIEPIRLAQEIALLADRADVTEELLRLESHVSQFRALLGAEEAIGRKLDFLLQEMHREANTIGSKTTSAAISHQIVDLKSELERMREQVQNVE